MKRVLCIPDWHIRDRDFRSIIGYVDNIPIVAEELRKVIRDNYVDMLVFLGDVSDGGYKEVHVYQSHLNMFESLVAEVSGEAYLNIGNHYFHSKSSNIEVLLSQPCGIPNLEYIPGKKFIVPEKPLFRVVDNLLIEGVQLAFHHYSDVDKDYGTHILPGASYVVGFYHDECVVPNNMLAKLNMQNNSQDSYLSMIYSGVRIAIHGHLHIPIPLMVYNNTAIIVPGAIAPTQNSDGYIIPSVNLPLLQISSGMCTYSTVTLNTHVDNLKFIECAERGTEKEVDKIRKIARETVGTSRFCTIGEYIDQKGYNAYYKDLLGLAMKEDLTIPKVYDIIHEVSKSVIEV